MQRYELDKNQKTMRLTKTKVNQRDQNVIFSDSTLVYSK